jgi:hypothetical protein
VSRGSPARDCFELPFRAGYPIDEPGEVALEDYARELLRARAVEGVRAERDPAVVTGVHVCGLGTAPAQQPLVDIEDFARSLVARTSGGGLGWS